MAKINKIAKIRKDTEKDMDDKLRTYKICCLIRPTGFGKTWTMTRLISKYTRVLYVYPSAAIKNTVVDVYYSNKDSDDNSITDKDTIELAKELRSFDHVDMMTYMKVQSLSQKDVDDLPNYDLIVFDEAHCMGAKGARKAIDKIFKRFKESHIIGATATPNRMDGYDVVGTFFDNVVVFPYTLHDAFQDNLLQKPIYFYCTYNVDDVKKNALKEANDQLFAAGIDRKTYKRKEIQTLLRSSILHESSIFNMDNVIRSGITKYVDDNYFKFICFFGDIDKIDEQGVQVREWFQKAFPDYKVNTMNIHSRDKEALDNVNKLDDLKHKDKEIDLIFCVNMINVGYHINDLTGILMYRGTQSNIIYIQQLGRALSSGSDKPCIVFDVVDNIHRKALYEMQNSRVKNDFVVKVTDEVRKKLTPEQIKKLDNKDLRCRVELRDDEYVVIANGEHYDRKTKQVETSWWSGINKVEKEDLYAEGWEATYRELIAKAVAEPISHLCREAVNLHFRRWCRLKGIKYPITKKELKEMYGIPEKEWREDFKEVMERHGLDYPWQDAKKIVDAVDVPLEVFASIKEVSVPRILELLGVA